MSSLIAPASFKGSSHLVLPELMKGRAGCGADFAHAELVRGMVMIEQMAKHRRGIDRTISARLERGKGSALRKILR